jgi:hypothetical protein
MAAHPLRGAYTRRMRATRATRWGSSSLAPSLARVPTPPSAWRQRRSVAAAIVSPRLVGHVSASVAPRHRGRHQPSGCGAACSQAHSDRCRARLSTVVRPGGVSRPCASASRPRVPARYARTVRYTLAREPNRVAAIAVGFRLAAHQRQR